MTLAELRAHWTHRREDYARTHATVNGVAVADEILRDLNHLEVHERFVTLQEAALASGYTTDHSHPDVLSSWIEQAERKAKLPKLRGGLLHPYRRKWATERKHLSVKDVAAAGGWQDVTTLLTFYQQPDLDTMLAVMSEPRKVTESVAVRR